MISRQWMWNERQQVGTDYESVDEVRRYEERMGRFRDLPAENSAILQMLNLPVTARIIEIGTGTGHFARAAAGEGLQVVAADISKVMLEYAASTAADMGLGGIVFVNSGFLELELETESFDGVYSSLALHHLPDVWKMVALEKIYSALKAGGQFILRDVVFDWSDSAPVQCFDNFVNGMPQETQAPAAGHVAKEYSTLEWIMRGLLERAGFKIITHKVDEHCLHTYHCRK